VAQKKALLILSMSLIMDLASKKEDIKYVGRLSRTDERRINIPPLEKTEARHPAKSLSQLSIIGWKADLGSLRSERGRPRYVCGKEETDVLSSCAMCNADSFVMFRGTKVVLAKLICNPVAFAKSRSRGC
jgi:hypothetical protein